MQWAGMGGFALLLLIVRYGQYPDGRLSLPETSLGNPNDLAVSLLLASLFMVTLLSSRSKLVRVMVVLGLLFGVYNILQTGSRANFLTVLVVGVFGFLSAPARIKGMLVFLGPLAAIAMIFLLPASTTRRLTMIVLNPAQVVNQSDETRSVVGSQMARTELQKRAIEVTLQNPLLGVGPLMFADAVDAMVREDSGMKSGWQNAHNVYLQLGAENGIPAFVLFVGTMIWGIRTNIRVYRLVRKDARLKAYETHTMCLMLLMVAYGFGITFGNYIYDPGFPILIGLTAANYLAIQRDIQGVRELIPNTGIRTV
jgi:O-antigen ligase